MSESQDLLTHAGYDWPTRYPAPLAHQVKTAEFMVQNPRSFIFNDIGCVDAETEYLSPTGWESISGYKFGEVAQYNLDTGQAEFVTPQYIKLPCDEFYHIKTKYGVDQMLSSEHRVLYVSSTGSKQVAPMSRVAERHHKAKYGFKGRIITTFKAPETCGVSASDDELRLMVAVIADGYFPNKSNRCIIRIKKRRKQVRLSKLLFNLGIKYKDPECAPFEGFKRFSFISTLKKKEFDNYFWDCNERQLRVVADELLYWDGSFRKSGGAEFCSTSKKSVDFAQYCFAAIGRSCTLNYTDVGRNKRLYTLYIRNKAALLYITGMGKDKSKSETIHKVPAKTPWKYCFSVPSKFLILRRNGRVFITGNTAKTLSALWAADFLMRMGKLQRVLIAAPLSTLDEVWANEIFNHMNGRTYAILHGSHEKRLKELSRDADFYIINHDGLEGIEKELSARTDIKHVILDEGANFRNSRTNKWKVLNRFAGPESGKTMWWMTGSPMPKGPEDLWGQARIINPQLVPKYFTRFRAEMMYKATIYKWLPKPGWEEKCYAMMHPSIRFKRDNCIDLPPCITESRRAEMHPEQRMAYTQMAKTLVSQLSDGLVTAGNEAAKRIKLIQIAAGAVYDGQQVTHWLPCTPKLNLLIDSVYESGNKAIVFVPFRHSLPLLYKFLTKQGLSVGVVYGDVSRTQRSKIFKEFQQGDLQILLAHPGTMAHGLTLTKAHTIIWWAPLDDFGIYEQANGRITRPGQTVPQTIIQLSCSEIERRIYTRLKQKMSAQGILLEMFEEGLL